MKTINPTSQPSLPLPNEDDDATHSNDAATMIRHKLATLYTTEPDVVSEAIESIQQPPQQQSVHQRFMSELAQSGKPFAVIQTEWHGYYAGLSDAQKHEVWEEFYNAQTHKKPVFKQQSVAFEPPKQAMLGNFEPTPETPVVGSPQTVADLKKQIKQRVKSRQKLSRSSHLKSLMFGLGVGGFTVLLLLFGFFNERFIAPFITPSRSVSSTPLILDASTAVGKDPKIIIPKINVEVPVVYDVDTVEEKAVQSGLERGVVHYATTSNPGESGNGAVFGHSSNNLLNRGQYKFAFVLLSRLEKDDTFYLEKDGIRYVYKVFEKRVVPPSDTSVLRPVAGKTSTMALITCDPPGTTINRLVVWGEQVSPDPTKNTASTALQTDATTNTLAGNPPSLWSRIWGSIF
jgi:sortase A